MGKKIILATFVVAVILAGVLAGNYINYKRENTKPVINEDAQQDDYKEISITAVGDCTFGTDINYEGEFSFNSEFKKHNGDATYFLKNVRRYFEDDDLTIVNFEGTLSERGKREDKEFAFRGKPEYVKILTTSSVEATNLANNHTRDYGDAAFSDTKKILSDNGIVWFEGKNYGIKEVNGIKIGMIGTNTLRADAEVNFKKCIENIKEENPDLIVASFHWGDEGSHIVNGKQKELAKMAIDNGADLVIGHHPHVLQGIEKYRGKYILYSLGNFCFGGSKNPKDKDTMIFKQTFVFKEGKLTDIDRASLIPCSVSSVNDRNNFQPVALSGEDFARVSQKIAERSAE